MRYGRMIRELGGLFLEALPIMAAAGLVYWFVRRYIQKRRFGTEFKEIRRRSRLNEIIGLLLVIWAALIIDNTLIPPMNHLDHLRIVFPSWGLIPEIFKGRWIDITHSMLNILMFVPIGLALPFVLKSSKFKWTVLAGFCFTYEIEFLQGFISQRDGNIDDVICNTLGVIAGYLLYLLMKLIFPKFTAKCSIRAEHAD